MAVTRRISSMVGRLYQDDPNLRGSRASHGTLLGPGWLSTARLHNIHNEAPHLGRLHHIKSLLSDTGSP